MLHNALILKNGIIYPSAQSKERGETSSKRGLFCTFLQKNAPYVTKLYFFLYI